MSPIFVRTSGGIVVGAMSLVMNVHYMRIRFHLEVCINCLDQYLDGFHKPSYAPSPMNYRNTTQTPNTLFDHHLPYLSGSELKVIMIILRRTHGQFDPSQPSCRLHRAWVSQKLFSKLTGLSGRAVSTAIASLMRKKLIEVKDEAGKSRASRESRKRAVRLFFSCSLEHDQAYQNYKSSEPKAVCDANTSQKNVHSIKLNKNKSLCDQTSLVTKKISDQERLEQILGEKKYSSRNYNHIFQRTFGSPKKKN